MRFFHGDGTRVHLSYGTNVHPAESLPGVLAQLDRFAAPVREQLGWDRLGLGLWLAADVAAALAADRRAVRAFRHELDARGLEVVTVNAFPYRGFHDEVVKHAVYRPLWTEPARLRYTVDCARVLSGLLPDGATGSVSTLPLGWRDPWTGRDDDLALAAFDALTAELARLADLGRLVTVAVEPEPGCVLDTVADAVGWLAGRVDPQFVGLCLDTCHLAVSFADPVTTVDSIHDAGLRVHKVQASAALHAAAPAEAACRAALAGFAEPRYLHQVRTAAGAAADDLPEALSTLDATTSWRVHFHVPLHAAPDAPLAATTGVLEQSLAALYGGPSAASPHPEGGTYTWGVLPPAARPADDARLVAGIAAELATAGDLLLQSGLSK